MLKTKTFLLNCNTAFCYHMSCYNEQNYICGKAKNHSEEAILTTMQCLHDGFLPKCEWATNLSCGLYALLGPKEQVQQLGSAPSRLAAGRSHGAPKAVSHKGAQDASCFTWGMARAAYCFYTHLRSLSLAKAKAESGTENGQIPKAVISSTDQQNSRLWSTSTAAEALWFCMGVANRKIRAGLW